MPLELQLLISLAIALGIVYFATPVAIRVADRLEFYDRPVGYKGHARADAVPRRRGRHRSASPPCCCCSAATGGAALPLLAGVLVLWALGTLDDRRTVTPALRVAGRGRAGGGPVGARPRLGPRLGRRSSTSWSRASGSSPWSTPSTSSTTWTARRARWRRSWRPGIAVLGLVQGDAWLTVAAAALCGACLGFLPHNLFASPARIFLGDGGSMPIGFAVAALVMIGTAGSAPEWQSLAMGLLLVGVPALDTALVIVSRTRRGISILTGGRDHLTHRTLHRVRTTRAVALVAGRVAGGGLGAGAAGDRRGHDRDRARRHALRRRHVRRDRRVRHPPEPGAAGSRRGRGGARAVEARAQRPPGPLGPARRGRRARGREPVLLRLLLGQGVGPRRPRPARARGGGRGRATRAAVGPAGARARRTRRPGRDARSSPRRGAPRSSRPWSAGTATPPSRPCWACSWCSCARRSTRACCSRRSPRPACATALVVLGRLLAGDEGLFLGSRLNAPLGYVNGEAAFFLMLAWPCLAAAEQRRSPAARRRRPVRRDRARGPRRALAVARGDHRGGRDDRRGRGRRPRPAAADRAAGGARGLPGAGRPAAARRLPGARRARRRRRRDAAGRAGRCCSARASPGASPRRSSRRRRSRASLRPVAAGGARARGDRGRRRGRSPPRADLADKIDRQVDAFRSPGTADPSDGHDAPRVRRRQPLRLLADRLARVARRPRPRASAPAATRCRTSASAPPRRTSASRTASSCRR